MTWDKVTAMGAAVMDGILWVWDAYVSLIENYPEWTARTIPAALFAVWWWL